MFKKLFLALLLCLGSSAYSEDLVQQQVDLIGPVGVEIPYGSSSWSARLTQYAAVNPLRVLFWNTGECRVIPITSLSVKYVNDNFWYSTNSTGQGYYHAENTRVVEAVKLDFYQNQISREMCVVKITGLTTLQ